MAFEQVEVKAVTPCFAPNHDLVEIHCLYTLPIKSYKVEVYDFQDRLVYRDAAPRQADSLPERLAIWDGSWTENAPGGPGRHYVNPLLSLFRIVVLVEPDFPAKPLPGPIQSCLRFAAMAGHSVAQIVAGYQSRPIANQAWAALQPRIGKDLTTARYASVKLRLMEWEEVYLAMASKASRDGNDYLPANFAANQAAVDALWPDI